MYTLPSKTIHYIGKLVSDKLVNLLLVSVDVLQSIISLCNPGYDA